MRGALFSQSLYDVFEKQRRALHDTAKSTPCNVINNANLVDLLVEKHTLPIPEFDTKPISADLDDRGEQATYIHEIKNRDAFYWKPSSSPLVLVSYDVELNDQRISIRFRAYDDSAATKGVHRQIADAIKGNVDGLAREIPGFNVSLRALAEAAVAERRKFCEDLERRRKELL